MHHCCYPVVEGWVESHILPSSQEDSIIINRIQLFLFIFICNIQVREQAMGRRLSFGPFTQISSS